MPTGDYFVDSISTGRVCLLEKITGGFASDETDFEEAYIIYEGERINLETCIFNREYKYVDILNVARLLVEKGKVGNKKELSGTIQKFELIKNGKSYFADLKMEWEE